MWQEAFGIQEVVVNATHAGNALFGIVAEENMVFQHIAHLRHPRVVQQALGQQGICLETGGPVLAHYHQVRAQVPYVFLYQTVEAVVNAHDEH